jgi:signal transduction histidine kinase
MTDLTTPGSRSRLARLARGWRADAAVALAVTVVQLAAYSASLSWHGHDQGEGSWPSYVLLSAGGLALLWRRRHATAVLAVSLGATLWAGALGGGFIWLALIAAFISAAMAGKHIAAAASVIVGYLASLWPPWQIGTAGHVSTAMALGIAAWLLVLLAIAELIRIRNQRAAAQRRSQEEEYRRRASEDRVRMARDLHDVLAHNISVINVQSNTALHLMDRQPERAREALTAIHSVSKQALAELRSVLGVLREDGVADGAPRLPGPGLALLPDLVAASRASGLDIRLRVQGDQRPLPGSTDVAAYRIVQESVTNVRRHSAARTALVRVAYDAAGVAITVEDGGPAASAGAVARGGGPGLGMGIAGMASRARELGGGFRAGPLPTGGFQVAAWLPDQAGEADQAEEAGQAAKASQAGEAGLAAEAQRLAAGGRP